MNVVLTQTQPLGGVILDQLKALKYFVKVVGFGNFTKAAHIFQCASFLRIPAGLCSGQQYRTHLVSNFSN